MLVADGLFAHYVFVDIVQWQCDFNELAGGLDENCHVHFQVAGRTSTWPSGLVMRSGNWLARSLSSPIVR